MPSKQEYPIAEAKNRLPAIIHDVETGDPVKLTRYGKPVAILLSIKAYENLQKGSMGFWKTLSELRKYLEKEKIEVTDSDFDNLRDISEGREASFPE